MVTPFTVFGYGSLIFKPPPHTIRQVHGYLKGYVRRFAQSSHDHRGTRENPGRVVTLVHKEDWDRFSQAVWIISALRGSCYDISSRMPFHMRMLYGVGIAYTIDPAYEAEVRDYLDYREKDGYTMESLDIHGIVDGKEKIHNAFCYVGRDDNPSFVGSEPLDALAYRIWRSIGPSGPNKEYLYKLADSVRELSPDSFDSHLFALEDKVRLLDSKASLVKRGM